MYLRVLILILYVRSGFDGSVTVGYSCLKLRGWIYLIFLNVDIFLFHVLSTLFKLGNSMPYGHGLQ